MSNIASLESLQRRIDTLRSQKDRAEGELKAALETLQEEFGCASIGDAEALMTAMRKKIAKAEEQYDREFRKFETKWGAVLNDA